MIRSPVRKSSKSFQKKIKEKNFIIINTSLKDAYETFTGENYFVFLSWFPEFYEPGGPIGGGGIGGSGLGLMNDVFSVRNANCKKNCFDSLFQCVQNLPSDLSTSRDGILKPIVSYGSAENNKYCHCRSGGSIFCSYADMKRCLG